MTSTEHGLGQLICGMGGALLIVSLFLPGPEPRTGT